MCSHAVVVSEIVTTGMHAGMRFHSRTVTEVYYTSLGCFYIWGILIYITKYAIIYKLGATILLMLK